MPTARDLRRMFVEYFVSREHRHVASAPLVPADDPTLLFTTAGMVQFKNLYSGLVQLPYRRATSIQKCLRAGGKGSDLENVGRTVRHFTFFEMLGNFAFGDYFKHEAIEWAWDFSLNHLKLDPKHLFVTVYEEDDEAATIWEKEIGLARDRIVPLGKSDNFWGPAGESGACGPCSELHIDLQKNLAELGPLSAAALEANSTRLLEFWNLVFPQFDQQKNGKRLPLKNRGIDTGMGLERLACIVQGKSSPYETDEMARIVKAASDETGVDYRSAQENTLALNAIADHVRALTFTLTEGIIPSNEGRGYVLRRILRRAARFGKKIGVERPFLHKLVEPVVETMGPVWPEVKDRPADVAKVIRIEEERFLRTLNQGSDLLEIRLDELRQAGEKSLPGEDAFKLFDTYGFPLDLTVEVAHEAGFQVDLVGFNKALDSAKALAKASWKGEALAHEAG
ncbi:MAG: alanine--tRNA ligase, partial [bacterium]